MTTATRSVYAQNGTLYDYATGEALRAATPAEQAASDAEGRPLVATGVIEVRDVWGLAACETLDDLCRYLRSPLAASDLTDNDFCDLPTYGGQPPADTYGIWSWDATRLLVGEGQGDLAIVPRVSYDRLTDDQITALRDESGVAGDTATVADCDAATEGDYDARVRIAGVLQSAIEAATPTDRTRTTRTVYAQSGTLYDYATGEALRPATPEEQAASDAEVAAGHPEGVIEVVE